MNMYPKFTKDGQNINQHKIYGKHIYAIFFTTFHLIEGVAVEGLARADVRRITSLFCLLAHNAAWLAHYLTFYSTNLPILKRIYVRLRLLIKL